MITDESGYTSGFETTPSPQTHLVGWTGNKCEPCKGHGVRMQDGEERRCDDCAGTGDEYGPKFPPDDFFDDKFDKPVETDTPLQAAAREAGWALTNLVDEIKFEKRQQVVNIINRLSASLAAMDRRDRRGH